MSRKSIGNSANGHGNTLFNYFTKSPSVTKRKSPEPEQKLIDSPRNDHSDSDEEIPIPSKRKRMRLASEDSDDSNEENKGKEIDKNNVKSKLENSFKFEGKTSSPKRQKTETESPKAKNSKNVSILEDKAPSIPNEGGNWLHCRLDWLKPDQIRDSSKRRPDHPEYDPKTLFVPKDFLNQQTPAHKQWWEMKSQHYDCVLFFKVGKFYELYHMDAAVGVTELGFSYMKGDFAHSGFPESAYARMVSTLVQKGYRVARVEQTETPEMMQDRMKKSNMPAKAKVVRREICQISCKGTEICGLQDNGPNEAAASYMFAISEFDLGLGCSRYGVCFIDTSIGMFHLGQFDDDRHSSRLLTTLAHYPPSLVLCERNMISERTKKVLNMTCVSIRREALAPNTQFWSANHTLKVMAEKYYQKDSGTSWPVGLKPMLSDADSLGLTPSEEYELAIKALGACIWYLTDSCLDMQIMEMSQFSEYYPQGVKLPVFKKTSKSDLPNNMILDSSTLANLHIIGNDASLISILDHCVTPMGKRLLYQWVCSPSCVVEIIKERQEAISYLLQNQSITQEIRTILNTLPDMERIFTKIHSLGSFKRSKEHPDSRAILYEEKTYSKRKVLDFISLLNGFEAASNYSNQFENCESVLLKRITQFEPNGLFPNYIDVLNFFKGAFDHNLAQKEGTILPKEGVDKEYDDVLEEISEIESDLQVYLKTQEKYFNCRVTYFGSDKKRYQLEIPESKANKANHNYQLEGAKKGFKRFSTVETKDFLTRMLAAEDKKREVLKDLSRRIFEKFSQSHNLWQNAINCISKMDVIISLSEYTRLQSGDICIPDISILEENKKPFIKISDGRHPCIQSTIDFIPNNTHLNHDGFSSLVLLTGPNMGGKSTLMRQLGLLTIMAQIGCHVPAVECSLNVVDRIFTRLGAHDDIITGQSTFLVELSETAAILKHTTIHSLVLLDELGRGTSTYDGTAIAASVVEELSRRGCRTMFSTHYHTLVEDFKNNAKVSLAHMACMVETDESETSDSITEETVTFLYKLSQGACPKSYGFNAARLAGIKKEITHRAHDIAIRIEIEANLVTLFKKLCNSTVPDSKKLIKDAIKFCNKLN